MHLKWSFVGFSLLLAVRVGFPQKSKPSTVADCKVIEIFSITFKVKRSPCVQVNEELDSKCDRQLTKLRGKATLLHILRCKD